MKRVRKKVASKVRKKAVEGLYAKCLYVSSGALARAVERVAIGVWKRMGLSPSQAYILQEILHGDVSSPSRLAENLLLSPSTVTRLVDKLEKMDLIYRGPYEQLVCIRPTEKAWALEPRLLECQLAFEGQCLAVFGEEGQHRLTLLLNTATDKLAEASNELR